MADGVVGDDILRYSVSLLGDESVGKTSLVLKFKGDDIPRGGVPATVSVDFHRAYVTLPDGRGAVLHIWDAGGRRIFHGPVMNFLRGARINVFIIVFAVNNSGSFDKAFDYWLRKIEDDIPVLPGFPGYSFVYLVGTKSDLNEEREVSQERAQFVADNLGLRYFEVSSHFVDNLKLIFETLIQEMNDTNNLQSNL